MLLAIRQVFRAVPKKIRTPTDGNSFWPTTLPGKTLPVIMTHPGFFTVLVAIPPGYTSFFIHRPQKDLITYSMIKMLFVCVVCRDRPALSAAELCAHQTVLCIILICRSYIGPDSRLNQARSPSRQSRAGRSTYYIFVLKCTCTKR